MMHLQDDFEHTEIENKAAEDSPTIRLVRYLIDKLRDDALDATPAGSAAFVDARAFIARADEEMDANNDDGENATIFEAANPIIAALSACITAPRSIYSFIINWSDSDVEQGTFGTTVRAWDYTHAEFLARAEMETAEGAGSEFDGTIVDQNVGASWLADDLEKALRGLLSWSDAELIHNPAPEPPALITARQLLAKIDAY